MGKKGKKQSHETAEVVYVHELVAKAWVPNPNNYQYVKHLDGNKLNNRAENLMWVATLDEVNDTRDFEEIQKQKHIRRVMDCVDKYGYYCVGME